MSLKRRILNFFAAALVVFGSVPMTTLIAYADDPVVVPQSQKTVKANLNEDGVPDGTYDITIEIKGASAEQTEATKANVVVVLDTSGSMSQPTVFNSSTNGRYGYVNDGYVNLYRWDYGFWADCVSVDSDSYSGTVYSDADCEVTYSGTRYTGSDPDRLTVAKGAVNDLAEQLLSENDPSDPNLADVVEMAFINFATTINTNNAPTTSLETFQGWVNSTTVSTGDNAGTNWEAALTAANSVSFGEGDTDTVYIIFVSDGNPTFRTSRYGGNANECYRREGGYGSRCIIYGNGHDDPSPYRNFNAAKDVATSMISDGKELFAVGAFGNVTNMTELGGTYKNAADSDALEEAFADIVDKIKKGLTITDLRINDGITSATSMPIKGTASAFRYHVPTSWGEDYAPATFNSETGKVEWNPGSDKTLMDGQTASLTFTVWPSQEALDCIAQIRNQETCDKDLAAMGVNYDAENDTFNLITNTAADFTYVTVTKIEGGDGSTQTVYSTPQSAPIPTVRDDAPLPVAALQVTKKWADGLDPGQRDDVSKVELNLYVDRDEEAGVNTEPVRHYVFEHPTDSSSGDWIGVDDDGESTYAIAPGVMKYIDGSDETKDLEKVAKRIVMVGDKKYAVLEEGHDYEFDDETHELSSGSYHYHITKRKYHPMIVDDGSVHDVEFSEDGTAIIDHNPLTTLSVENTLNGGILVSKVVENNGSIDRDVEDEFEITINLTGYDEGQFRINNYKYSIDEDGNEVEELDGLPGAKMDFTGGQVVATITTKQKIMVVDVPTGTTIEVIETKKPAGYSEDPSVYYEVIQYTAEGKDYLQNDNSVYGNASSTAVVTNTLSSGDLVISKEVVAAEGTDEELAQSEDNKFDFTLKFYEDEDSEEAVREEQFSLAHDQSITFNDIPTGWYYEIVEAEKDGYNEGETTTKTGTIEEAKTKEEKFTNNYAITTPLEVEVEAIKSFVSGREGFWIDDDEFTFILTGQGLSLESDPVTLGRPNPKFKFNLTKAGTFTYTISEKEEDENGDSLFRPGVSRWGEDTDVVVTIITEDNGDGTLSLVSISYDEGKKTIYNTYEGTSVLGEDGELVFKKKLEGRDWVEGLDVYDITISSESNKLPEITTLTAELGDEEVEDGTIAVDFGTIEFSADDVGNVYSYIVTESFDEDAIPNVTPTSASAAGISFTVKVVYNENNDGQISLQVSEHDDTFVNVYTPDEITTDESELTEDLFTIYKVVQDDSGRFGGEEFNFTVESDDFDAQDVSIETATEGNSEIAEAYTFTEVGTYTFTVSETAGDNIEVDYDDTVYTVEIEVADNPEEGKLEIQSAKINGEDASDTNKLLFTNVYDAELYNDTGELTVKKVWNNTEGLANLPVSVTIELYADDVYLAKADVFAGDDNSWTHTFTGLYKYNNGEPIVYTISEKAVLGGSPFGDSGKEFIVYGTDTIEGAEQKSVEGKWTAEVSGFEVENTWEGATSTYAGEAEFYIQKIDEFGEPLSGVTFTMGEESFTTDDEGRIPITVPVSTEQKEDEFEYTIVEASAPQGYDEIDGSATVTVTCSSKLTGVDEIELKNTYAKTCEFSEEGSEEFAWILDEEEDRYTLVVTNNRSLADSLIITKELVGATFDELVDNDLTFIVTGPVDFEELEIPFADFEEVEDGVYEYEFTGRIPTGDYTVTEENAEIANKYTLEVTGDNGESMTLESGGTEEFVIVNTYTLVNPCVNGGCGGGGVLPPIETPDTGFLTIDSSAFGAKSDNTISLVVAGLVITATTGLWIVFSVKRRASQKTQD